MMLGDNPHAELGARCCTLVALGALLLLGGPFGGCPCRGGPLIYLDEDFEQCAQGGCPWGTVQGKARLVSTIHANQVGMSLDEDRTEIRRVFDGGLVIGGDPHGYYGWPGLRLTSSCFDGAGQPTLELEAQIRIFAPEDENIVPSMPPGDHLAHLTISCGSPSGRYASCSADLGSIGAGAGFSIHWLTIRTRKGPCVIDRLRISQGSGGGC